jgi:hypothetical protein
MGISKAVVFFFYFFFTMDDVREEEYFDTAILFDWRLSINKRFELYDLN